MGNTTIQNWELPGSDNQPIYGSSHLPPPGVKHVGDLLICHGFKGYKDYGFVPHLAQGAANAGLAAHRFNFSHSGMTNNTETFERPDLFERDTWGRQIFDLHTVAAAVGAGQIPGADGNEHTPRPSIWYGHSRGGITVLLAASRTFAGRSETDHDAPSPVALISAAAPHASCYLSDDQIEHLRAQGYLDSPSSRTQQVLRIGKPWLDEIEQSPQDFDPVTAIENIPCPVLILHGDQDGTVPVDAAHALKQAAGKEAELHILPGASHVFGCPNPLPLDKTPPPPTQEMIHAACVFAQDAIR